MIDNKIEKSHERTKGTERTTISTKDIERSPTNHEQRTKGTNDQQNRNILELSTIDPLQNPPEKLISLITNRPCYKVHDDWFKSGGETKPPGLYWHGYGGGKDPQDIDIWISTPIHADAITANENDESFGLLLRFLNPYNKWREWAMPMHLLKGNGDEMRGELLQLGIRINLDAKKHFNAWLMLQHPTLRIIAAMRTGWHSDQRSFILPNETIGNDNVRFQSEYAAHIEFAQKGTLDEWRDSIPSKCQGNPILLLAISAAFAAPLLLRAKQQITGGGGIHLFGQSSKGKTTALQIAASVWGSNNFVRTWRATANGLEATATLLNDNLLVLDEIGECESREIGTIVYALANGQGKQRAQKTGGARESAKWRTILLSSGERTLSSHIQESGLQAKAGQEARLLNIPATNRAYGAFDDLHGFDNGRAFADHMKKATGSNYGIAGRVFIKKLIEDNDSLPELYASTYELPAFSTSDGIESRAAGMFALFALAGEKATEYGLTGWEKGDALNAAVEAFNVWRKFRGEGQTEVRQLLQLIRNFIDSHGDSRFSCFEENKRSYDQDYNEQNSMIRNRAGYWKDTIKGRVYMFNSGALQEAATGYDLPFILSTLKDAGWIERSNPGRNSWKVRVNGKLSDFYYLLPLEDTV